MAASDHGGAPTPLTESEPLASRIMIFLDQHEVRDRRILDRLGRQTWPRRHPWISGVIALPMVSNEETLQTARAALRCVLPDPIYGSLVRWRGASKNRRCQARVAKIGRSAGQDVADD
jgi:hypothetical protein